MYLQITTRCNMSCEHCGFSCGANGKNMPMKVVKAAFEEFGGEVVTIGGGEPTIHPKFWEILGFCLGHADYLWMATNGKKTETALTLAGMARKGVLGVALSQDIWHDEIDPSVVRAFKGGGRYNGWDHPDRHDLREIRNVEGKVVEAGRAIENGLADRVECICSELLVDPEGTVWACGCQKVSFGNVLTGVDIPDWYEFECTAEVPEEVEV